MPDALPRGGGHGRHRRASTGSPDATNPTFSPPPRSTSGPRSTAPRIRQVRPSAPDLPARQSRHLRPIRRTLGVRVDDNAQYTVDGTCPAGYTVTPNHLGYAYLARALAERGYVVSPQRQSRHHRRRDPTTTAASTSPAGGSSSATSLSSRTGTGAPARSRAEDARLRSQGHAGFLAGGAARPLPRRRRRPRRAGSRRRPAAGRCGGTPQRVPGTDRSDDHPRPVRDRARRRSDLPRARRLRRRQHDPAAELRRATWSRSRRHERVRPHLRLHGDTLQAPRGTFEVWGANHNAYNTEWLQSDSLGCSGVADLFPQAGVPRSSSRPRSSRSCASSSRRSAPAARLGRRPVRPVLHLPSTLTA